MFAEPQAVPRRTIGRPFPKGTSGNPGGRPRSARSRMGEAFNAVWLEIFNRQGQAMMQELADNDPKEFLRLGVRKMPRLPDPEPEPDPTPPEEDISVEQLTDAQRAQLRAHIRAIAPEVGLVVTDAAAPAAAEPQNALRTASAAVQAPDENALRTASAAGDPADENALRTAGTASGEAAPLQPLTEEERREIREWVRVAGPSLGIAVIDDLPGFAPPPAVDENMLRTAGTAAAPESAQNENVLRTAPQASPLAPSVAGVQAGPEAGSGSGSQAGLATPIAPAPPPGLTWPQAIKWARDTGRALPRRELVRTPTGAIEVVPVFD